MTEPQPYNPTRIPLTSDTGHPFNPRPVLYTVAAALLVGAIVFYAIAGAAFHPSSMFDEPDATKGYVLILAGTLLLVGAVVPLSAALLFRRTQPVYFESQ